MTPEQQLFEDIQQAIRALPNHDKEYINCIAEALRAIVKSDPRAALALALVGAQAAAA